AVGGVHLVGPPVAELRGALGGVAERAVEGRGVLGGVGQDGDAGVAGAVEGGPDGADLAVHHPAGGDDVGAGAGLGQGDGGVALQRGVVVDFTPGGEDAA